jgi:hypothetical protein
MVRRFQGDFARRQIFALWLISPLRFAATGRSTLRPRPEVASTPTRTPIDVVALQNDCGDPSFVIDNIRKKKKKKQGAD